MEFLEKNPLYVVAVIAAVIWLGFFYFLMRLDKRISKLEKEYLLSHLFPFFPFVFGWFKWRVQPFYDKADQGSRDKANKQDCGVHIYLLNLSYRPKSNTERCPHNSCFEVS